MGLCWASQTIKGLKKEIVAREEARQVLDEIDFRTLCDDFSKLSNSLGQLLVSSHVKRPRTDKVKKHRLDKKTLTDKKDLWLFARDTVLFSHFLT